MVFTVLLFTHHDTRDNERRIFERQCGSLKKFVCKRGIVDVEPEIESYFTGQDEYKKEVTLIALEANLGSPGGGVTTITNAVIVQLVNNFPKAHIHLFSGGTPVINLDPLFSSISSELRSRISDGVGQERYGIHSIPKVFLKPLTNTSTSRASGWSSSRAETAPSGGGVGEIALCPDGGLPPVFTSRTETTPTVGERLPPVFTSRTETALTVGGGVGGSAGGLPPVDLPRLTISSSHPERAKRVPVASPENSWWCCFKPKVPTLASALAEVAPSPKVVTPSISKSWCSCFGKKNKVAPDPAGDRTPALTPTSTPAPTPTLTPTLTLALTS